MKFELPEQVKGLSDPDFNVTKYYEFLDGAVPEDYDKPKTT